ncbi:MAG: PIN domain-containing protein [Verrucomicrobiota bacterium]
MKWLVDTNVVSAASKRNPSRKLLQWLDRYADDSAISIVSLSEIAYGVAASPDEVTRQNLINWLVRLRAQFADAVLELDEATLVEWKKLIAELKGKNRTISCEDSLIAATARYHSLTIVTLNMRDFEVTDVACINPMD